LIAVAALLLAFACSSRTAQSPGVVPPESQKDRALSREVVGTHERRGDFFGCTLQLLESSRFQYSDWSCVGESSAQGTWAIVGDQVELHLEEGDGALFLEEDAAGAVNRTRLARLRVLHFDGSVVLVDETIPETSASWDPEVDDLVRTDYPEQAHGWNRYRRISTATSASSSDRGND
jgi:hypothetical protein